MDHRVVNKLVVPGRPGSVRAWRLFDGAGTRAMAQGPQFDVGSPPGAAGGASAVGQPLGAAAFPDFGTPSNAPFSGRAGAMGSHVPGERSLHAGSSRFQGPGGSDHHHSKRSSRCRRRSMASWSCPPISLITERPETWIWTPRSTCSSARTWT